MKFAIFFVISALALAQAQAPSLTKAEQLQDAARKGDAAAVRKLLDEGVDVNTKFRYNATALFYACDHGHVDVVKVLLERGADMNVKDTFYGFTPLMLSTSPAQKKRPEHTEIAKLLIAKGAPGKETALAGAVQSGDTALAKFILDTGVPAASLSDALETAKAQNKAEIVTLLEQAGAKPHEEMKMEPAQLERYAGTYRNAAGNELVVAVNGARLSIGNPAAPPANRGALAAKDATTFRGVGMQGTTFVFKIEGDKVTALTVNPAQGSPVAYTRVEGK
jgi:ankyrin repeat protein